MSESLDEPGTISPSLVPQQKEVSSHCTDPNDGSSDTIPPSSIPGDGSWDTIAPSPISQQTVDNTDAGDGPCDPVTESGPHETTDLSESGDRPSYTYTTTADPTESGDKSPDTTTADPTESGDKSSDSTPPSSIPEWTAGLTEVGDNSSDTTALSPILQQTSNLMEASHNSSDAIHSASVAQQTTDHMEACHGSPYAIPPSQQTAGLTETGHGSSDHNHHPSNPNKDKETTKELIAAISASHQKISASNNTTQYLFEDHPAYITFREFIYIVYMDEEQVLSDFNLRLGLESDDGVLGMLLEGSLIRPHKNKGFELSIRPFFRCFITPTVNISHIKSTVSTAIEFLVRTRSFIRKKIIC